MCQQRKGQPREGMPRVRAALRRHRSWSHARRLQSGGRLPARAMPQLPGSRRSQRPRLATYGCCAAAGLAQAAPASCSRHHITQASRTPGSHPKPAGRQGLSRSQPGPRVPAGPERSHPLRQPPRGSVNQPAGAASGAGCMSRRNRQGRAPVAGPGPLHLHHTQAAATSQAFGPHSKPSPPPPQTALTAKAIGPCILLQAERATPQHACAGGREEGGSRGEAGREGGSRWAAGVQVPQRAGGGQVRHGQQQGRAAGALLRALGGGRRL
jgi:hypothetical protein